MLRLSGHEYDNSVLSSNLFLYLSTTLSCENLKGQNNLSYGWLTHLMILKLFWPHWTWLGSFQLHSMLFPMAVWSSQHSCLPVGLSSNCPHVNLFDNAPFNLPFCVCVCVLVIQSCPTLCDRMDCSLPGSSVHGILQARTLEWVAISYSRVSSQPRNQTQVSCITGRFFTVWATREATLPSVLRFFFFTRISFNHLLINHMYQVGKILWRRKQQPSLVFLPGESHGQKSLVDCNPRGHRAGHDWACNMHAHTISSLP